MSDVHTPPAQGGGEPRRTSRREFLRLAGLSSAVLVLPSFVTGCVNEEPTDPTRAADIDLGTDEGLLAFAWAAAQMSYEIYWTTRFYSPYAGVTALEAATFQPVANHGLAQKSFLRRIGSTSFPEAFRFDWSAVDFSSRESFYPFIQEYEEKLAGGFAWAIGRAQETDTAIMLAKMGSVAGRHVAVIQDLADIRAGRAGTGARTSFASDDAVEATTGLQRPIDPAEFLEFIRPHLLTPLSVRGA